MIKLVSKKRKPQTLYETGRNEMGLVYADIELTSVDDLVLHRRGFIDKDSIKQVSVRSLVDTGAYMLTINDDVKNQLDLPVIERQFVTLADETQLEVDVVGPVEVRFENRRTTCDAVVLPTARDVLLGSIPMEDMDVLVHPKEQKLVVNPKHPYVANKYLKVAA
jgi:clan AA aspartic protease